MKIRASDRSRKVVVEAGSRDRSLPAITVPELRLKTILAAVDFSECSRKVLHYALSLSKQFSAEVILLHVVEVVPLEGQAVPVAGYSEEAEGKLRALRKEFGLPKTAKTILRTGTSAHPQIVEAAEEYNCDLIIVGNQGRTGLSRVLLWNTAEKVVRHAPCHVLVIRAGDDHQG